jgi:hypothetical protein
MDPGGGDGVTTRTARMAAWGTLATVLVLTAVGGKLEVDSALGRGTRVTGTVAASELTS